MTIYSYAQLESLWINAGGPSSLAPVAAAIAEAESGGNSDAYNGNDSNGQGGTQVSAGLWQISNGTMTPVAGWSNPATNAQDAVAKWKGAGGFSPWGTYTSGAYKAFLNGSTTPDPNVPGSPTQTTSATGAALTAIQQAQCALGTGNLNPLPSWVPGLGGAISVCLATKSNVRSWLAVGNLLGGAIVMGIGLGFTLAFTKAGRTIIALVPGGQLASGAATKYAGASAPSGGSTPPAASSQASSSGSGPSAGGASPVGRQAGEPFRYAKPQDGA